MADKRFHDWIGLSGVDADENPTALLWAKRLELPLVLVALLILISWYWESSVHRLIFGDLVNWIIWLFFVAETSLLTALVNDKRRYLMNNWLNLVVIFCGIPVLWSSSPLVAGLRSLRLLLFLSLMVQISSTVREVLAKNNLGSVLVISVLFIVVAGILIAGIDPNITTPFDGIWWAWVTATTVGYGDVVPTSNEGRILGGVLILLGLSLTSLITANISAYFISRTRREAEDTRLQRIETSLRTIEQKLDLIASQHEDKP